MKKFQKIINISNYLFLKPWEKQVIDLIKVENIHGLKLFFNNGGMISHNCYKILLKSSHNLFKEIIFNHLESISNEAVKAEIIYNFEALLNIKNDILNIKLPVLSDDKTVYMFRSLNVANLKLEEDIFNNKELIKIYKTCFIIQKNLTI